MSTFTTIASLARLTDRELDILLVFVTARFDGLPKARRSAARL